jgi:hypothetical protein
LQIEGHGTGRWHDRLKETAVVAAFSLGVVVKRRTGTGHCSVGHTTGGFNRRTSVAAGAFAGAPWGRPQADHLAHNHRDHQEHRFSQVLLHKNTIQMFYVYFDVETIYGNP